MNCRKYQISKYSLIDWMKRFEKSGIEGLKKSTSWKRYSKELKEAAVRDYLSGKYSQYEIVRKYEISSRSVLRWVERYNSHRIKGVERKVKLYDKGRKTTWEERIQIVLYCLENNKDYQMTASPFKSFMKKRTLPLPSFVKSQGSYDLLIING
jgi:transposase